MTCTPKLRATALALLTTLDAGLVRAGDDAQTRQLWDDAFRQKRTQGRPRPAAPAPAVAPARSRPTPSTANPLALADQLVGLTLWRLRPVRPEDEGSAAMVWASGDERLTAERVSAESGFAPGARVRLAIESGRNGFLYIIDRERYEDGSLGEPFLIFPRLQIRGGDNRVRAGRVIEVPDLADAPPYFTLRRSRPDHEGELISVLVADAPLAEVAPGHEAVRLGRAMVEAWERRWSVPVRRLEAKGAGGALYTRGEREAAGAAARLLTYEEPLPQTLFHVQAPPGQPLLLKLDLAVRP
jgi:hypothetical protein